MNIEKSDDEVMKALQESKLEVPDFGPTNMGGNRWFDQMAFTKRGKAENKTQLIRHGKFDWRHAVFGPHPKEAAPVSTAEEIKSGITRPTKSEMVDHYEESCSGSGQPKSIKHTNSIEYFLDIQADKQLRGAVFTAKLRV